MAGTRLYGKLILEGEKMQDEITAGGVGALSCPSLHSQMGIQGKEFPSDLA